MTGSAGRRRVGRLKRPGSGTRYTYSSSAAGTPNSAPDAYSGLHGAVHDTLTAPAPYGHTDSRTGRRTRNSAGRSCDSAYRITAHGLCTVTLYLT